MGSFWDFDPIFRDIFIWFRYPTHNIETYLGRGAPVILHRLGIICRYEIAAIDLLWHQICTSSFCNECESNRLWSRCQKFWEGDPFLSTPLTIEQRPSFKIFWDFDTAICDTVTLWHIAVCDIAPLHHLCQVNQYNGCLMGDNHKEVVVSIRDNHKEAGFWKERFVTDISSAWWARFWNLGSPFWQALPLQHQHWIISG